MWDFVLPLDEQRVADDDASGTVAFRPKGMALGCSVDQIQDKISANAKAARLIKLLKGTQENEALEERTEQKLLEGDVNKSELLTQKKKPVTNTDSIQLVLSKSQKKRRKKNLKDSQKKLLLN